MMRTERATSMPPRKPGPSVAKILRSEMIYKGPVFGVRRDEVLEPGGMRTVRDVITHPGSVVVLPVLPDGRILRIRQYRHATRQCATGRRRKDYGKNFPACRARAHDPAKRAAGCEDYRRIALLLPLFGGEEEEELTQRAQRQEHRVHRERPKSLLALLLSPIALPGPILCFCLRRFFSGRFFFFLSSRFLPS